MVFNNKENKQEELKKRWHEASMANDIWKMFDILGEYLDLQKETVYQEEENKNDGTANGSGYVK